jgi:hypothetical protein
MGWKQSWKWIRRARQHTCQWKVVEAVAEAYEAVKGCLAERLMRLLKLVKTLEETLGEGSLPPYL